jgi:hydrogenase small subunit
MTSISRRDFVTLSARLAAVLGLGARSVPALADTLADMATGRAPVLWLQGQSCSGCSVSLLDSEPITVGRLVTKFIGLQFHQTLSGASCQQAVQLVNEVIQRGGYVLVVEGTVPAGMPAACRFGDEPFSEQVVRAARNATAVLAVGSCATWGGIPAAEGNPTGAVSVPVHLKNAGVAKPTILIPGCPAHPDWIVGTIAHFIRFGLPPLDAAGRPQAFFSKTVHDQCPRFSDYERERFAAKFGDDGCLFKLGCVGFNTRADCTLRGWNGGVNHCIAAHAPCVGCAGPAFARAKAFPIYRKNEGGAA